MVYLIIEKIVGIDITRKIWSYYVDLLINDCIKTKKSKKDRYFVVDDCVWITFHNHIVLTSTDVMSNFYRQYIEINKQTIIHLLYRPDF